LRLKNKMDQQLLKKHELNFLQKLKSSNSKLDKWILKRFLIEYKKMDYMIPKCLK